MIKIQFCFRGRRFWIGVTAAAACFAACYSVGGSIPKCLLLSAAFLAVSGIRVIITDQLSTPFTIAALAVSAFTALYLTQFVLGEGLTSVRPLCILLGYCCCMIFIDLLFLIWPNVRFSAIAGIGVLLLLSTANHFVYVFRGTELAFVDLFSISTAANVVSQYEYKLTPNIVYAWVMFFAFSAAMFSFEIPPIKRLSGRYCAHGGFVLLILAVFMMNSGNVQAFHFWNHGTYENGYILNFVLTVDESFVDKPSNYAPQNAEKIAMEYETDSDNGVWPNIIVIMDESYADLSVLGSDLNTDTEISPFISSLEENTIKGYALTSAFGGRTANSEFEFLTGFTMGFLPNGSIAFQQFVDENQYSIVKQLESLGYQSIAMHPYLSNGWMRDTVWPALGFDECYFVDDFPQENLMRELVSDQELVDYIISAYESRNTAQPLFLYGVSMQNHSGYDYTGEDFETTIHLAGYSQDYPDAEQYLTLIQATDKAVENLIGYFSGVDEPVVILFYGDHLPSLNQDFYEEIRGGPFETLDEQMLQYSVPFFIWANYDIEEQRVERTSLSYLSTYVYEAAGIGMPVYNQFLKQMEGQIPAINMLGYYSLSSGRFLSFDKKDGLEKEWLEKYQILQYNALFDKENLCSLFVLKKE